MKRSCGFFNPRIYLYLVFLNAFLMKTASLLEFSANLKAYLDNIERDNETLFVKRSKHKGTVIISIAEYNSLI